MRIADRVQDTVFGVVGIFVALCVWMPMAHADMAGDLGDLEKRLDYMESNVAEMRGRYVKPLEMSGVEYFTRRFERAVFLYNDGDFVHASIIFSDLINYPNIERRAEYYDLIWYLGDSFSRDRNYISARTYLEKVVARGDMFPHFRDAIVRLIEISVELGRFEDAEDYYDRLNTAKGGEGWDLIQYAFAKSLQKKNYLDRAFHIFRQIPMSSNKYAEAEYFAGVILVQQNKLDEARETFRDLMSLEGDDKRSIAIRELATLAVARILFEQGNSSEALSLYRLIPIKSDFFDQAYYEVCWIYIKEGKFAEAANTLDILLLALPGSIYAPDSQVLKGNILLWEGRFSDANYSFQTVINKYASVVDTMDRMLVESEGKRAEEIQQHVLGRETTLPPIVMEWLSQEEGVSDALGMVRNLEASQQDAAESHQIIDALKVHLNQESKANLFPNLREGREAGVEVEHGLTEVRGELTRLTNQLFSEKFTQSDREKLLEIQKKRRDLEEIYAKIPKTAQQRMERRDKQVQQLESFDKSLYALKLQMEGLNQLMTLILERHEQLRGDPKMSQNYLREVKEKVERERAEIQANLDYLQDMQSTVREGLEMAKIGDEAGDQDERIRKQLEETMAQERDMLERMRTALTPEGIALFERVEKAKGRADRLDGSVQTFFADLETLVEDRVKSFIEEVENEERELERFEATLVQHRNESSELAAKIAYQNLKDVRERFHDIVLKANVGMVDVAWERRQKVKEKVNTLLEQRSDEKDQLKITFQELRGE